MKTLLLLRHGKSNWDAQYQLDHDRPLAKRGRKAAALMGRYLSALDEAPDVARRYSVMSIPTMIVFKDGEPAKRLVGAKPKAALLDDLSEFI